MANTDALEARADFVQAMEEYGSSITLKKTVKEVRDPDTYDIITPASTSELSKLTDNEKQSYSIYLSFYTDEPLN